MIRPLRCTVYRAILPLAIFCALSRPAHAGGNENFILLPLPLKMEFSHRFSPWDANAKYEPEKFQIFTEAGPLWVRLANRSPASFAEKQFLSLPAGYSVAEFGMKRRWGSVQGVRTVGFNHRQVPRAAARKLTGGSIEIPKSIFGTKLFASFLHGAPATTSTGETGKQVPSPADSQATIVVGRDLGRGFKLGTEWSHAWTSGRGSSKLDLQGGGWYLKLNGTVAGTETTVTCRFTDSGLSSPALPGPGREQTLATLMMQRTLGDHKLSYSSRIDAQQVGSTPSNPSKDTLEHTLRWTYSPKLLPLISATQTWSRQNAATLDQSEESFQLSLNKSLSQVVLGFSYLRGTRFDELLLRTHWERSGFTGNAAVEIGPNRKLSAHYESSETRLPATSQLIGSQMLQLRGRVGFWGERASLQPVLDYRRQEDARGILQNALLSSVLGALIQLPRGFPGTDVLLTCSIRRLDQDGQLRRQTAGLTIHWNFKS